jgi:transposase
MRKRRVFDETFKKMAIELSHAKGSVQEVARELGIDSSRITKWRQNHKSPSQSASSATGLSQEQKQIRPLQKELKDAQFERDILKSVYSAYAVEQPLQLTVPSEALNLADFLNQAFRFYWYPIESFLKIWAGAYDAFSS